MENSLIDVYDVQPVKYEVRSLADNDFEEDRIVRSFDAAPRYQQVVCL